MTIPCDDLSETLLPRVRQLAPLPVDYPLDASCVITCRAPAESIAGERFADLISAEWGFRLPVRHEGGRDGFFLCISNSSDDGQRPCRWPDGMALADEEYRLRVDADGAVVSASTVRGLLWGAMTLRQLVQSAERGLCIRGVEIQDRPHYPLRGFMIDSGRSPNSLPKLKRIIRICSAFKLNAVFFREGDDEMSAVRYAANTLGSSNPWAFTMQELGELSAYAQKHGIALIPEVESLGHSAAKGVYYPDLVKGGFEETYEGIGVHIRKAHLAPGEPGTFKLLESIYDEMFATLPTPFMHLGMDEVRLPPEEQSRHMQQLLPLVFRCAEDHGVQAKPIVWSDAPETPDEFKEKVYRCLWKYDDAGIGPISQKLLRQGIEALSQPGCRQPVLMAGGAGSGHTPYSKEPSARAFENLAAWARWGAPLKNCHGLFAVQWSGNMTDLWLPDFLAAADFGWMPPQVTPPCDEIERRIGGHLARVADAARPDSREVDPPAWDGIWLKDGRWDREVLTTQLQRK